MFEWLWFYFGLLFALLLKDVSEAVMHVLTERYGNSADLTTLLKKYMTESRPAQHEKKRRPKYSWEVNESMASGAGKAMAMR